MISQNIRSLREHEGFTQEALASRLGVARQTVAKWESLSLIHICLNVAAEKPLECPVCHETFYGPNAEDLAFNSAGDVYKRQFPIPRRR